MEDNKLEEKKQDEKKPNESVLEPLTTAREIEQAIEAILFAAGYPVRYDKLGEVLGLSTKDVKTMVRAMADHFAEEDTHHGIQLLLYPTACQLCTKEVYAPYIREALGIRRGGNLSASSMEVLAVVAYNQPVTRSFIDLIRGADSSYAVGSLLDKGLIEAAGRLDAPGRPMLYVTSDKFLRVFGIKSLDELPETEALSVAAAQAEQNGTASGDGDQLSLPLDGEEAQSDENVEVGKDYTEPVDPEEETDPEEDNGLIFEDAPASGDPSEPDTDPDVAPEDLIRTEKSAAEGNEAEG